MNFWASIPGLGHTPVKGFSHNEDGKEVIIITRYEVTMVNGNYITDEIAAHYKMKDVDGKLLTSRLRVIMVRTSNSQLHRWQI